MPVLKHPVKVGQLYVHIKRGGRYRVMGLPKVQDSRRPAREGSRAVVYMCLEDGEEWVRDLREFSDGRFKLEAGMEINNGKVPKGTQPKASR